MSRSYKPSHRQIEANRRNATNSTGPRTREGKAQSRANALKHGLAAEVVLLPSEDPAAVESLREALVSYYSPVTDWEEQLVEQAISIMVRLKRVPTFEAALFKWIQRQQSDIESNSFAPFGNIMADLYDTDVTETADLDEEQETGRTFAAMLDQNLLGKLNRYELTLQGRLNSMLRQLDELTMRRLRKERDG